MRDSLSDNIPRYPILLRALTGVTLGALAVGAVAWLLDARNLADAAWAAGTVSATLPAIWWLIAALRQRRFGVDVIAVLSLLGTLLVGEHLAGALIPVMLTTGRTLEEAAERRATKDLRSLLQRVPKVARRRTPVGVQTVAVEDVAVGDVLVVGPGEVLPVDATIASTWAVLDESALTGESMHVELQTDQPVRSGTINAGGAIEIRATAIADDSTYAGIVRLAKEAAASTAPVVRLADRLARWFVPLTLAMAGSAWLWSGSPGRAVAVLVVATPCPLLLAAPVAIVSGLSQLARLGVIIRSGGALENLGRATTLILDKTGTVTSGRPRSSDVVAAPGWSTEDVLRLAASADQFSPHVVAQAIVAEAIDHGLSLRLPTDVVEEAGTGTSATVDGRRVTVGNHPLPASPPSWAATTLSRATLDAEVVAWVDVDGELAGAILLHDPVRPEAPRTMRRLRAAGITRIILLTGDRPAPAQQVGTVLGMDDVQAAQTPTDKVERVRAERRTAGTIMVGDGVNDAPALAAATVGIAMGARGATASSEAADIVLTTDRLDRLADAMLVARRSRRIAMQSAVTGMALSLAAMALAAVGLIPAATGALLQEAIDLAVIVNALRALRPGSSGLPNLDDQTRTLIKEFAVQHDAMRAGLEHVRYTAHRLAGGDREAALSELRKVDAFLQHTLLPHEHAEDSVLYPALARPLGSTEATATMSRTHVEIDRLARRLHQHLDVADAAGAIDDAQSEDLLATLYGLHEVLSLHFLTEEESYFTLAPDP